MKVHLEISEADLKELIMDYLEKTVGELPLSKDNIKIEVKSKQNYKAEWEVASFRAIYDS